MRNVLHTYRSVGSHKTSSCDRISVAEAVRSTVANRMQCPWMTTVSSTASPMKGCRSNPPAPVCRNQALLPLSGNHPPHRQSDPQNAPAERDQRLPSVLSEKEIGPLIGEERPKDDDRAGRRDRAQVETLYSCGLGAGKAVALNWSDIDGDGLDPPGRQAMETDLKQFSGALKNPAPMAGKKKATELLKGKLIQFSVDRGAISHRYRSGLGG